MTSHKMVKALLTAAAAAVLAAVLAVSPQAVMGDPAGAPSQPTGLTGDVFADRVVLCWDDPGDAAVTGYQILRLDRELHELGTFEIHVDDTGSKETSYVDTNVQPSRRYVYRIKARYGDTRSAQSRWFDADTPASGGSGDECDEPPQQQSGAGTPQQQSSGPAFTARAEDVPASHGGRGFSFDLVFSEAPANLSYKTLRDSAFTVTGATITNASRVTPGSNLSWKIEVTPDGGADVALALPARGCGTAGAVCLDADTPLSSALDIAVPHTEGSGGEGSGEQPQQLDPQQLDSEELLELRDIGLNPPKTIFLDSDDDGDETESEGEASEQQQQEEESYRDEESVGSVPDAPVVTAVHVFGSSAVVEWKQDPGDDSVTGYRVWRGASEDSLSVVLEDTGSDWGRSDDGRGPVWGYWADATYSVAEWGGRQLLWAVQARNAAGLSERSAPFSALIPPQTPPAVPTGLTASVASDGAVTLSWDANTATDAVTGYQVLRGTSAGDLEVVNAGAQGTSWVDTSAVDRSSRAARTLFYALRAQNAAGLSPQSGTVSAAVPGAPSLSAPRVLLGQVTLSWLAPVGGARPVGFEVLRGPGLETLEVVGAGIGAKDKSWTDTDFPHGHTLLYVVRALYRSGPGPRSAPQAAPDTARYHHSARHHPGIGGTGGTDGGDPVILVHNTQLTFYTTWLNQAAGCRSTQGAEEDAVQHPDWPSCSTRTVHTETLFGANPGAVAFTVGEAADPITGVLLRVSRTDAASQKNFSVEINSDNGGQPHTTSALKSQSAPSSCNAHADTRMRDCLILFNTPLNVTAGRTYWLRIIGEVAVETLDPRYDARYQRGLLGWSISCCRLKWDNIDSEWDWSDGPIRFGLVTHIPDEAAGIATAVTAPLDGVVSAALHSTGDMDYFKLENLQSGTTYTVSLYDYRNGKTESGTGGTSVATRIVGFRNSTGGTSGFTSDTGRRSGRITPNSTGDYFLVVGMESNMSSQYLNDRGYRLSYTIHLTN